MTIRTRMSSSLGEQKKKTGNKVGGWQGQKSALGIKEPIYHRATRKPLRKLFGGLGRGRYGPRKYGPLHGFLAGF